MKSVNGGFTLIELLVALTLMTVLGVLSYRGLASIIDSRDHLEAQQSRWIEIRRAIQALDNDLMQLAQHAPAPVVWDGLAQSLSIVRLRGGDRVVEVRYALVQGGLERSERINGLASPPELVLGQVGAWTVQAPITGGGQVNWQAPVTGGRPPLALRVQVDLADAGVLGLNGPLHRVVALR